MCLQDILQRTFPLLVVENTYTSLKILSIFKCNFVNIYFFIFYTISTGPAAEPSGRFPPPLLVGGGGDGDPPCVLATGEDGLRLRLRLSLVPGRTHPLSGGAFALRLEVIGRDFGLG